MKEGTKSYLIGCHQFVLHPLFVLMAWRLEYKRWPKWWELICIFLHDVGICGRQYLSDDGAKNGHWERGACLAYSIIFRLTRGRLYPRARRWEKLPLRGFDLCAGHSPSESSAPVSMLFRADKRSWLVAPTWWLWWNYWVEWSGRGVRLTKPPLWKGLVAENLERTRPISCHQLYLENRR